MSITPRILDWCPRQSWNTIRVQVQGHGNFNSIWTFLFDTWSAQTELFNGQVRVRAPRTVVWVKELMARVTRTNEIAWWVCKGGKERRRQIWQLLEGGNFVFFIYMELELRDANINQKVKECQLLRRRWLIGWPSPCHAPCLWSSTPVPTLEVSYLTSLSNGISNCLWESGVHAILLWLT